MAQLEELLVHPKKHRMPCLLFVGENNNGETMIVNRFLSVHPDRQRPTAKE